MDPQSRRFSGYPRPPRLGSPLTADSFAARGFQVPSVAEPFQVSLYWWVALGSAIGGAARYWCYSWAARHLGETFPWGTLLVNVAGCSFIGLFATLTGPDGRLLIGSPVRQFVMVGVCGGFTTFSTLSLEALNLARDGQWMKATANVLGSLVLCLAGVWLGYVAATAINER